MKKSIVFLILLITLVVLSDVVKSDDVASWAERNSKNAFSFAVFGDSRPVSRNTPIPKPFLERVFKEISWLNPDFIVHMGDIVFGFGEIGDRLRKEYDDFLSIYRRNAGEIPMIVVPANHELQPGETAYGIFKEYFGNLLYYDFTFGNSHFIVVNTNFPKSIRKFFPKYGFFNFNDGYHEKNTVDWLKDILTVEASHTFVLSHVPLFSIKTEGPYQNAEPKFMEMINGVDAYFTAHRHFTYVSKEGRIKLLIVGGGGTTIDRDVLGKCDFGSYDTVCGPLGVYSYTLVEVLGKGVKYKILVPFSIDVMREGDEIYVINRSPHDLLFRDVRVNSKEIEAQLIFESGFPMTTKCDVREKNGKYLATVWVPSHAVAVLRER